MLTQSLEALAVGSQQVAAQMRGRVDSRKLARMSARWSHAGRCSGRRGGRGCGMWGLCGAGRVSVALEEVGPCVVVEVGRATRKRKAVEA